MAIVAAAVACAASARAESPADVPVDDKDADEVRVRAPLAPAPPKDRGVAGSVVGRERLRAPGLSAAEVLRTQPGVEVIETGGFGAPSTAAIRGATAEQTPVYLGSVRLNDDVAGTADLSLVPLWMVDRIEIYRGNAPVEADRLGIGGAILFEPRRPTRNEAALGGMIGSFGARRGWAYGGLRGEHLSALVGVSAEGATNDYPFQDDRGTLLNGQGASTQRRTNADASARDLWALGRWRSDGGGAVDAMVNAVAREQGVPRLALVPSRAARADLARELGAINATLPIGAHLLEAGASALVARARYSDPLYELSLLAREVRIDGSRVTQSLGMRIAAAPSLTLRPRIEIASERIARADDGVSVTNARRASERAAMAAEWRASSHVTVRALGSAECHGTTRGATSLCDTFAPDGRLGLELGDPAAAIYANVGRYARIPTLGELYGASSTVRGNAALVPERGETVDLGVRARSERGPYGDLFVFVRWADDLVAYARGAQGYVLPYNAGQARIAGAEALAGAPFLSHFLAEIAVTVLDPRDVTPGRTLGNDVLPFRSRLVAVPRLRAESAPLARPALGRLVGEARYVYQSSRYADPAGLGIIAEQGSLDFESSLEALDGHAALRLRLADILDQPRTDLIGYPLPGRSIYLSLESTW